MYCPDTPELSSDMKDLVLIWSYWADMPANLTVDMN